MEAVEGGMRRAGGMARPLGAFARSRLGPLQNTPDAGPAAMTQSGKSWRHAVAPLYEKLELLRASS